MTELELCSKLTHSKSRRNFTCILHLVPTDCELEITVLYRKTPFPFHNAATKAHTITPSVSMSRPRWNEEETAALVEIRSTLKEQLADVAQNLEVVGDRSLLRFYRGHLGVMPTVCTMITNYMAWRKENGVDQVIFDLSAISLECYQ